MFYVIDKQDKLSIFDDNKEKLIKTRQFMPQLEGQYTLETDIVTAHELIQHPNKVLIDDIEIDVEVPDYETVQEEYTEETPVTELIDEEYQELVADEEGNPILDKEGNEQFETKIRQVERTTYVTEVKTREVQKEIGSHTETITVKGLVPNPDYEQEEAVKERQRLDMLSLTKREVFLALYRAKGITPEMVRGSITDEEALIEFDYAERFYRGNPLIDKIGIMLGYSIEDLDHLFEYKELPENVQDTNSVEE